MDEYRTDIPEALPVDPRPSSYPPPSPPNTDGLFKGMFFGCLGCAGFLLLAMLIVVGSCTAAFSKFATATTESFQEGMEEAKQPKPALTRLRNGSGTRKIAVIAVHGTITLEPVAGGFLDEESGSSAQRLCRELRAAQEDETVASVILDMNTPGGEVVASDEIRSAVDQLRAAGKPVVTVMHTLGASGGYYIASGSDWIIANRLTMTGSVGVIMQTFEASGLLAKIGVKPLTYRSGNFKDMLSPMRPTTPEEDEYLNAMVKQDFHEFCQVIAKGRPNYFPTVDDVLGAPFADGRVVSGADALGYHLIDQLGDFDTAVEKARELCGSANAPVFAYSLRRDWRAWLTSFAAPAKPIEAKALERVLPAATLQPGVRYYLLPAAVN
ncbi:MAG: signal peptide peptidase SppA [Victivallales bacterium]|nr:signal peptide peptidase SppA [Victivallales bacterium]